MEAEFETKFIVLPIKYFAKLPDRIRDNVHEACGIISAMRKHIGKNPDPEYYFCNQDEPYADKVLQAILDGENAKEPPKGGDCDE